MASVPSTDDFRGPPPPRTARPGLPHFSFCVRDLLVYTAFLCVLLAGMVLTQGVGAAVVLLVALVIAAHVLSTALGSRLREVREFDPDDDPFDGDSSESRARNCDFSAFRPPQRSSWHGREVIGRRRRTKFVVAGSLSGGILGGAFLCVAIGDRTAIPGLVVGAVSLAVLGGWFAFLATSFYSIFRHGLSEAIAEQRKDELRS